MIRVMALGVNEVRKHTERYFWQYRQMLTSCWPLSVKARERTVLECHFHKSSYILVLLEDIILSIQETNTCLRA